MDPFTLSAGISAGSSLLGGLFGNDAADEAAQAQMQAAQLGIEEQRRQYDTTRKDLAPWRATGAQATRRLRYLLGLGDPSSYNPAVRSARQAVSDAEREYNALMQVAQAPAPAQAQFDGANFGENWDGGTLPAYARERQGRQQGAPGSGVDSRALADARTRLQSARNALAQAKAAPFDPGEGYGSLMRPFGLEDFEADPGYQFRLGQGTQTLENSAAARGMQLSGANLKALNRFNQDFASNEFGNAWNRDAANKSRQYGFLSGTSGQGLGAAGQTAAFGQQGANNITSLLGQQGNAQSAGIIGGANALQSGLQGASNSLGDYMMMKTLLRSPTGGGQLNPRGGY